MFAGALSHFKSLLIVTGWDTAGRPWTKIPVSFPVCSFPFSKQPNSGNFARAPAPGTFPLSVQVSIVSRGL
jgi:hypothetical protein